MLPSELLVAVFSSKGKVFAKYAKHDHYQVAADLINIFSQNTGKKRKELNAALDKYLEGHCHLDSRRVRGFFELLLRRCDFSPGFSFDVQPFEIRKKVFEYARYAVNEEERKAALETAAKELGIAMDYLLSLMFADMEEEHVLINFTGIDARTLVKQYNLSLVQTLLFKATEMEFLISTNAREVFSMIKKLGLMYSAYQDNGHGSGNADRVCVRVNGPASVLKLTEKYGTAFAKLLPAIVKSENFTLRAYVVRRKGDVRLYVLDMDARHRKYFSYTEQEKKDEYDSRLEESFAIAFRSLDTGWTLRREPCALPTSAGVIIPDFVFEKGTLRVYMEIVGFWTEEYLRKKIEKLSAVKDEIIVAVDETLTCSRLKTKKEIGTVIYFKNRVPLNEIVKVLKKHEDAAVQEELKQLIGEEKGAYMEDAAPGISGDVVDVGTVAKELNISPEAARAIRFKSHRLLGNEFVSFEKIQRLKEKLDVSGKMAYVRACEIIRSEGIKCADCVLQLLNYKVEWKSLEEKDAFVVPKGYS